MLLPECRSEILVTSHLAIIAGRYPSQGTDIFLWSFGSLLDGDTEGVYWDNGRGYVLPRKLTFLVDSDECMAWPPSPFSWYADPGVTTIDTEDVRFLGNIGLSALKANLFGGFPWVPFRDMVALPPIKWSYAAMADRLIAKLS